MNEDLTKIVETLAKIKWPKANPPSGRSSSGKVDPTHDHASVFASLARTALTPCRASRNKCLPDLGVSISVQIPFPDRLYLALPPREL